MPTCQGRIWEGNKSHICGKPAQFSAYEPPVYFCRECLHNCMEDESPEAQASVKDLDTNIPRNTMTILDDLAEGFKQVIDISVEQYNLDEITDTIAQRAFKNAIERGQEFQKARAAARRALVEFGTEPFTTRLLEAKESTKKEQPKPDRPCPFEDNTCPTCELQLVECPSGWVCKNGHGF